jgi:hypothetical protein
LQSIASQLIATQPYTTAMVKLEDDFHGHTENHSARAAEDQQMADMLERHQVSQLDYYENAKIHGHV